MTNEKQEKEHKEVEQALFNLRDIMPKIEIPKMPSFLVKLNK